MFVIIHGSSRTCLKCFDWFCNEKSMIERQALMFWAFSLSFFNGPNAARKSASGLFGSSSSVKWLILFVVGHYLSEPEFVNNINTTIFSLFFFFFLKYRGRRDPSKGEPSLFSSYQTDDLVSKLEATLITVTLASDGGGALLAVR